MSTTLLVALASTASLVIGYLCGLRDARPEEHASPGPEDWHRHVRSALWVARRPTPEQDLGTALSMGGSAGRSAGNRTSGEHRATQRERDAIDAPGWGKWADTEEMREVQGSMRAASCAVLIASIALLIIGIISVGVLIVS